MIQEFKVKNYLSFRDEATFSFLATDDRSFGEDQVVTIGKTRLLRFAILYGANASGKSNLLQAMEFMRQFWFAAKASDEESTGVTPFLLDRQTPREPSHFELTFFVGDTEYLYTLTLDRHRVHEETLLYHQPIGDKISRAIQLFRRTWEGGRSVIELSGGMKTPAAVREELTAKCLPNMSFFAARARVNASMPPIDAARTWMQDLFFPLINPKTDLSGFLRNEVQKNAEVKGYLLSLLERADFNITGMRAEKAWDGLIFEHTVEAGQDKKKYALHEAVQSAGTIRILGVEAAIYGAERQNGFLMIDEIESSLHPELVKLILDQYLNSEGRSQLLVTTHYDPLLDYIDSYFRKDSVWFTEKGEDGNTSLYSLVEFRRLNQIHSFQGAYRNGRFGALPNTY